MALGFGVVIGLTVALSAFTYYSLNRLAQLEHLTAERSNEASLAMEASGMGPELYQIIADAIINRDLDETATSWNEVKTEALDDLKNLASVADTPEEINLVQKGDTALKNVISTFETQFLPILQSTEGINKQITDMDDVIDEYVNDIHTPLLTVSQMFEKASEDAEELFAEVRQSTLFTIAVFSVVVILASLLIAWRITLMIVRPIKEIAHATERIAEGDLTTEINIDSSDEIGQMAAQFSSMVANLRKVIAGIQESSQQLASSSEELSSAAQNLSNAATEQASSLEETSASIEELTSSIDQNAENSSQANSVTSSAVGEADRGGQAVMETVVAMKKIAEQIGIINDIADQTNLLALNAAIEAARAGEMGKGFAVVAVEVRKLAERSQHAAKEINELAVSSVKKAEDAGGMIQRVVPAIQEASRLVQEIAAASEEQAGGSEQIRTALGQLDQVTQQNSSSSEEISSSSEELAEQAQMLQEMIAQFKISNQPDNKRFQSKTASPARGGYTTNASFKTGSSTDTHASRLRPYLDEDDHSVKRFEVTQNGRDEFEEF